MNQTVLVVAPHPDDETLGCGGSLLRHRAEGDAVHWLIGTESDPAAGFSEVYQTQREEEISQVTAHYEFTGVHRLGTTSTRVDTLPLGDLIQSVRNVMMTVKPSVVYLPFRDDAHSDHRVLFDAVQPCLKWFRNNALREVLVYETLSETGYNLAPGAIAFSPTLYVDITPHLEDKVAAMALYKSEIKAHPFPRSERAMRAQALLRGSECGCEAAEAFIILWQIRLDGER
jgi:LmbE family N-acetylglucosaminyl deacetylase